MKYAVIAISGSQHKIEENQIITVDNLNLEEGQTGTTDQVLLVVEGDKVKVGTPTVDKSTVEYKVVKNHKDDKVRVYKYKAKSRYHKTQGFRHQLTDIQITKIN